MNKRNLIWLVQMFSLCVLLTIACSPYETKDPTGARVIMLRDEDPNTSDGPARDTTSHVSPDSSEQSTGSEY